MSKTVIIGLLGTTLDRGKKTDRWSAWRPTVSLCRHEDFLVDRLDLLYDPKYMELLAEVRDDIKSVSPETEVVPHKLALKDPWDFEEVFEGLHAFAHAYPFDQEQEDYLIHITTGTHVAQICLFLLTESRAFPGRLLQTGPPRKRHKSTVGTTHIIDLQV